MGGIRARVALPFVRIDDPIPLSSCYKKNKEPAVGGHPEPPVPLPPLGGGVLRPCHRDEPSTRSGRACCGDLFRGACRFFPSRPSSTCCGCFYNRRVSPLKPAEIFLVLPAPAPASEGRPKGEAAGCPKPGGTPTHSPPECQKTGNPCPGRRRGTSFVPSTPRTERPPGRPRRRLIALGGRRPGGKPGLSAKDELRHDDPPRSGAAVFPSVFFVPRRTGVRVAGSETGRTSEPGRTISARDRGGPCPGPRR